MRGLHQARAQLAHLWEALGMNENMRTDVLKLHIKPQPALLASYKYQFQSQVLQF